MKLKFFPYLLFLILIVSKIHAVGLKGKVSLGSAWHPEIFLASINTPEDLFVSSPDFLLTSTLIGADGSFQFNELELPNELRFYRLYLVKNHFNPTDIINSDNRSIIHLILDNNSKVEVSVNLDVEAIASVQLIGSEYSAKNREFDLEFAKRKAQLTGHESRAQKEFIQLGIDTYIRSYVENCESALNGLYALYHIEEKEPDFLRNSSFYFSFQDKLHKQLPQNIYTNQYDELLESLVGFRELVCEIPGVTPKWKDYVILIEGGVIILLLLLLFVNSVKKKNKVAAQKSTISNELFNKLTSKEIEILKLVSQSKSNKEIALELFIELSTVKTHLNSIYKQLKVENRKEAANIYLSLDENKGSST